MNDLRARIAAIVERDRAQHANKVRENGGIDRNPLNAAADPPASGRCPTGRFAPRGPLPLGSLGRADWRS